MIPQSIGALPRRIRLAFIGLALLLGMGLVSTQRDVTVVVIATQIATGGSAPDLAP